MELNYKKNQAIRVIHSGAMAHFIRSLEDGLVEIALPDGSIIPLPIEAIEDAGQGEEARTNPIKQFDTYEAGIFLLLLPVKSAADIEFAYDIYLSNGSDQSWLSRVELGVKNRKIWNKIPMIESNKVVFIERMRTDLINDKPTISIELIPKLTKGTGTPQKVDIKLQAKNFHKYFIELFDGRYCYKIMLEKGFKKKDTRQQMDWKIVPKTSGSSYNEAYRLPNQLSREIDLHVEALNIDPHGMTNGEILNQQMAHFKKYFEEAIILNLDRVFIIHGVGKGVLKSKIHDWLRARHEVISFTNEYHPRYGYGATEIILNK